MGYTFFAAIKVPKGNRDAIKANIIFLKFHLYSMAICITSTMYSKNKMPCAMPIILFGPGMLYLYFNGMVIANNKKEQPSKKATSLNLLKDVCSMDIVLDV